MAAEIDWSQLHDEHGPSTDLPDLIAELGPDENSPEWQELWLRVYHQGSLYSASPHVLAPLLDRIAGWDPPGQVMGLGLAQAIVASDDFPATGFEEEIAGLRELAVRAADHPDLDRKDRIYVMMAAVTLSGDRVLGQALETLSDESSNGECPACHCGDLTFVIDGRTRSTECPQGPPERIVAAPVSALRGTARWLFDAAIRGQDVELASRLLYFFGWSKCPACGKEFLLTEAIQR